MAIATAGRLATGYNPKQSLLADYKASRAMLLLASELQVVATLRSLPKSGLDRGSSETSATEALNVPLRATNVPSPASNALKPDDELQVQRTHLSHRPPPSRESSYLPYSLNLVLRDTE